MHRVSLLVVSLFFILSFLPNCAQEKKKEDSINDEKKTREQMQGLARTFSDLLPFVTDKSAFHNPKNQEVILKKTEELSQGTHSIQNQRMGELDPAFSFLSENMETEVQRAYNGLKLGHREYARNILNTVSGYCIRCHTRTDTGTNIFDLTISSTQLAPIVRAELYAATRQFDRALKEFAAIIQDQSIAKERPFDWERAVRYSLAIAVRYKDDPKVALNVTKLILGRPQTPAYLRNDAKTWEGHLKSWEAELKDKRKALTDLPLVEQLIAHAQRVQEYPTDHSGDVLYLRASAKIHELLLTKKAEASQYPYLLYLAGTTYEALRDLGYWTLHEHYYRACIKSAPQTETAAKCFNRYEQSVYAGYSGSSGTSIPLDVQQTLDELQKLAQPLPTKGR